MTDISSALESYQSPRRASHVNNSLKQMHLTSFWIQSKLVRMTPSLLLYDFTKRMEVAQMSRLRQIFRLQL